MSSFLYNPDLQSRDDLLSNFVARQDVLERLVEDLRSGAPQHHLIVGQRGMGKTTLLERLALEVERDPELSGRWLALSFPEEQYNVARLSDLWLNCLDALADALETGGHAVEAEALDTFIRGLPAQEEWRAARALERLLAYAREKRGLVLCIDNVDQVLGRLHKDQWAIRKVLGAAERLVFVGASAAPFDAAFTYDQPFYDFFAVTWLKGLDVEEMRRVVLALAEREKDEAVVSHVGRHPERVKAVHVLTGGNPRTVVLLYQVLARDPDSDVRRQLESLLDQVTPLYKARVEALADQAQVVLDALATAWDPATAAEIAESTRMEVNTVSTQLSRLHDQGIVEKVELPDSARQGFQVGERFFNVWYLMRARRRSRARLRALAQFLEDLYGSEAWRALQDVRGDDALMAADATFPSWRANADVDSLLPAIRALCLAGRAPNALALLEEQEVEDRARPLYAAVSAIAAGDPRYLEKFAPEVAGPAKELLDVLWPEEERPAPKAPPRKKRGR